jgi:hypothetical protein
MRSCSCRTDSCGLTGSGLRDCWQMKQDGVIRVARIDSDLYLESLELIHPTLCVQPIVELDLIISSVQIGIAIEVGQNSEIGFDKFASFGPIDDAHDIYPGDDFNPMLLVKPS